MIEYISELKKTESSDDFPIEWHEIESEKHFWFLWRLKVLLSSITRKQLNIENSSCLDIGCGSGTLMKQLSDIANLSVDGADLDIKALTLHKCSSKKLFYYDIYDKNVTLKNKYDFLFIFDVLEHIPQPKSFIEASLFHLKKGGMLFINVPALAFLFSKYDKVCGHLTRFNKASLLKQLPLNEIRIVEHHYWGLSLVPILLVRKFIVLFYKGNRIVNVGMKPPGKLFNSFFLFLMKIESFIWSKPIIGASLFCAIKKTD